MEENMKEVKIEENIESKNPDMDKADSSPSLVDTIVTENDEHINISVDVDDQMPSKKEIVSAWSEKLNESHDLKLSNSFLSLIGSEPKEISSKYSDIELGLLVRELKSREREVRKLYDQFCNFHDEKKRLVKK